MKIDGKKFCFLGDSITEGYGTTAPEKVFHQILAKKHNLKAVCNFGISGTRIARQTAESTFPDQFFELRVKVLPSDTDFVVVFGGTNDFGHGDAHFGELDDDSTHTFCGAVNSLITCLENNLPNTKMVFVTPLHRVSENTPSDPDGKILADYVDAIRKICAKRGVKVIDLFELNPLDCKDPAFVPDGLHPNDAGHAIMAEVIAKELLKL